MDGSKFLKIVGVFFIFVAIFINGVFFLLSSLIKPAYGIDFDDENVMTTEGSVIDIKEPSTDEHTYSYSYYYLKIGDPNYGTVYKFNAENGEEYIISTYIYSSDIKIGDTFEVYYDKNDPLKNVPSFFTQRYEKMNRMNKFISFLTFVPGIAIIIIGFVIGNKTKKKKMSLQNN